MNATNYFSNQESLEQHIRDLLRADGEGDSFIDEYIDCIFAYSDFEVYEKISDDDIRADYKDWLAE